MHFICKYKTDLTIFLYFMVSVTYYFFSLKACPPNKDPNFCSEYLVELITPLMIYLIFSALMMTISIIVYLRKGISRIFPVLYLSFYIYISFIQERKVDFWNHNTLNFFAFIFLTILFLMLYYIIKIFFDSLNVFIALGLFTFLLLTYLYKLFKLDLSCTDWDKGFKQSLINNINSKCIIEQPRNCYLQLFDKLNISNLLSKSCSKNFGNIRNYKAYYLDADIACFPNTALTYDLNKMNTLHQSIRKNMKLVYFLNKDVNNYDKDGNVSYNQNDIIEKLFIDGYEICIDFTGDKPQIKQKIFKRHDFIKIPQEEKSLFKVQNVIWIFIDGLSRAQFKVKLPKTFSYFERFYHNESSKSSDDKLESFQFFKYYTHMYNTFISTGAVVFGLDLRNSNENTKDYYTFAKNFRDKGFVNGFASNLCNVETFSFTPVYKLINDGSNYHNENFAFACDPSISVPLDINFNHFDQKAFYSPMRRCIYGKDSFEYLIEYADEFLSTYEKNNKFLTLYFMDAHEPIQNVIKYLDNSLVAFLEKNQQSFIDNNTAVVLYSDHGNQLNSFAETLNFEDYLQERNNSLLSILLPVGISDKYRENLLYYENRLITPWDLNSFFLSLINDKPIEPFKYRKVIDLLTQKEDRDCDDSGIGRELCFCKRETN